tara:strand:- start:68 stop:2527 length:2460 start_codon:yes stop_codon:yes gene_type:complete
MYLNITAISKYQKSLQNQDTTQPYWVDDETRPSFSWKEVYTDSHEVIVYNGENFSECADQLLSLLDYIININPDKFQIIADLKDNIKSNCIDSDEVSELNKKVALKQIKSSLENSILLLKYNNKVSKEELNQFTVNFCLSGAASNIDNMMQLFYPSKITGHLLTSLITFIKQIAIEYSRLSGMIDDNLNPGDEIHVVNGLFNLFIENLGLKKEEDDLIPYWVNDCKEDFLTYVEQCVGVDKVIDGIISLWPIDETKSAWSHDDINKFFSYFDNINKSPDDPEVNYWEIMFDLDLDTMEYFPKKNIDFLYKIYLINLLEKNNLTKNTHTKLQYNNEDIYIINVDFDGSFFVKLMPKKNEECNVYEHSTTYVKLTDLYDTQDFVFKNIPYFSHFVDLTFLFTMVSKEYHFELCQKLSFYSHSTLVTNVILFYNNLNLNQFLMLLNNAPGDYFKDAFISCINAESFEIADKFFLINDRNDLNNDLINEQIDIAIRGLQIDAVLFFASYGKWQIDAEYLKMICINSLYNHEHKILSQLVELPCPNKLSSDLIYEIAMHSIDIHEWSLLQRIIFLEKQNGSSSQVINDILTRLVNHVTSVANGDIMIPIGDINYLCSIIYVFLQGVNDDNRSNALAKILQHGFAEQVICMNSKSSSLTKAKSDLILYNFIISNYTDADKLKNNTSDYKFCSRFIQVGPKLSLSGITIDIIKQKVTSFFNKYWRMTSHLSNENWDFDKQNEGYKVNTPINYYLSIKLFIDVACNNDLSSLLNLNENVAKEYIKQYLELDSYQLDDELKEIINYARSVAIAPGAIPGVSNKKKCRK